MAGAEAAQMLGRVLMVVDLVLLRQGVLQSMVVQVVQVVMPQRLHKMELLQEVEEVEVTEAPMQAEVALPEEFVFGVGEEIHLNGKICSYN